MPTQTHGLLDHVVSLNTSAAATSVGKMTSSRMESMVACGRRPFHLLTNRSIGSGSSALHHHASKGGAITRSWIRRGYAANASAPSVSLSACTMTSVRFSNGSVPPYSPALYCRLSCEWSSDATKLIALYGIRFVLYSSGNFAFTPANSWIRPPNVSFPDSLCSRTTFKARLMAVYPEVIPSQSSAAAASCFGPNLLVAPLPRSRGGIGFAFSLQRVHGADLLGVDNGLRLCFAGAPLELGLYRRPRVIIRVAIALLRQWGIVGIAVSGRGKQR
uniref:Uncharacterized protein n=1 Tax=Oryza meridionalis TaxID=40149 RepID=A0A0E0DFT9_9ORYZ